MSTVGEQTPAERLASADHHWTDYNGHWVTLCRQDREDVAALLAERDAAVERLKSERAAWLKGAEREARRTGQQLAIVVRDLRGAEAERDALAAQVEAAKALHVSDGGKNSGIAWCENGCDYTWPCPTARALGVEG